MTTPALIRLRQALPYAHLALLTPAHLADLWRFHPAVDEVIRFEKGAGLLQTAQSLRRGKFDLGLVFPNSIRSALELWLSRIPTRIGYRTLGRAWLLTRGIRETRDRVMRKRSAGEVRRLIARTGAEVSPDPEGSAPTLANLAHHVHRYLRLAGELGAVTAAVSPHLAVRDAEVTAALERHGLAALHASGSLLCALNPGAEYGPAKRWPVDRFVETAARVNRQQPCCWLILGGPGDRSLAAELARQLAAHLAREPHGRATSPPTSVVNLAGETSLRELCALLRACRALLTNDTGPMHVAAAVGTAVVAVFGSTSAELTGPGLPGDPRPIVLRHQVPCAPCFLRVCPIDSRCMNGVSVDRVVTALLGRLADPSHPQA
jgi:heptosyltransferase-2